MNEYRFGFVKKTKNNTLFPHSNQLSDFTIIWFSSDPL